MREFKIISEKEFSKTCDLENYKNIKIPKRTTASSAGYDFYLPYSVFIESKKSVLIKTGIKAKMNDDEFLMIVIRSSLGVKKNLRMTNQVGIIDSDYYDNPDNEGHIMISLYNEGDESVELLEGERIAQGIFLKYLKVSDDTVSSKRSGGFGSTNK